MSERDMVARLLMGQSARPPKSWAEMMGPANTPQELDFQKAMTFDPAILAWRQGFQKKYGEHPEINNSDYDYRGAVAAGLRPAPYEHDAGAYHWPSSDAAGTMMKAPNHPTAWMETFMRTYGVDPHQASPEQLQDAYGKGIVPLWGNLP